MRLSAELLSSSEQRTNPLGEREIILRGLAIPVVEHLGVTRDAFDSIDFTDNRLGRLENFPRLLRLSSLLVASNLLESLDHNNLSKNVPNLKYLELSWNQISSLLEISHLGKACPKLEFLSLTGNPVTSKYLMDYQRHHHWSGSLHCRRYFFRLLLLYFFRRTIFMDLIQMCLFCYNPYHYSYDWAGTCTFLLCSMTRREIPCHACFKRKESLLITSFPVLWTNPTFPAAASIIAILLLFLLLLLLVVQDGNIIDYIPSRIFLLSRYWIIWKWPRRNEIVRIDWPRVLLELR